MFWRVGHCSALKIEEASKILHKLLDQFDATSSALALRMSSQTFIFLEESQSELSRYRLVSADIGQQLRQALHQTEHDPCCISTE